MACSTNTKPSTNFTKPSTNFTNTKPSTKEVYFGDTSPKEDHPCFTNTKPGPGTNTNKFSRSTSCLFVFLCYVVSAVVRFGHVTELVVCKHVVLQRLPNVCLADWIQSRGG